MTRLLVVDDDRRISMALCVRLRAAGYEIECAYDGDEAYASAAHSVPDLIIMDINMPYWRPISCWRELLLSMTRELVMRSAESRSTVDTTAIPPMSGWNEMRTTA